MIPVSKPRVARAVPSPPAGDDAGHGPPERARVEPGQVIHIRFDELEYDLSWGAPFQRLCRIEFEVSTPGHESVRGTAMVDRNMLARHAELVTEMTRMPGWINASTLQAVILDYRRHVVDTCIMPLSGWVPANARGVIPSRGRFAARRTYEFRATEHTWELVDWS